MEEKEIGDYDYAVCEEGDVEGRRDGKGKGIYTK